MATLTLTIASTYEPFNVLEENIVRVQSDTLGSKVTYVNEPDGGLRNQILSIKGADVAAMSTLIIPVTVNGTTEWVNIKRIGVTVTNSTGMYILYNQEGQHFRPIQTTDSEATFLTRVYEKEGKTVYTFDDVNATSNTVSLAASWGDKTASFTADIMFTIFGCSTDETNGIYRVDSSSYTGGKTVISVDTASNNIPSGSAETGSLYIQ